MDHLLIPMPDFDDKAASPLYKALILTFGWDEHQAMRHLQDTWRQAHLQWERFQEPQ